MRTATASRWLDVMSDRSGATGFNAAQRHSVSSVCEAFGIPRKDWPLFSRWAAAAGPVDIDAADQYLDVLIAERCRKPADDLLSRLIEFEVDGIELTVEDIRRYVATLMFGDAAKQRYGL